MFTVRDDGRCTDVFLCIMYRKNKIFWETDACTGARSPLPDLARSANMFFSRHIEISA